MIESPLCAQPKRGIFAAVKPLVFGAIVSTVLTLPALAVEFEKDVLPILKSNCIKCHGDDKEKGEVNLEPHKIKNHIGSGLAIVPGRPTSGLVMKLIQSDDPDNRMPPKGPPLSDKEVEVLRQWIGLGAELGVEDADAKPVPGAPVPVAGVWTNQAGKEIKATLMSVEGDKAVLKMENGKLYKYPIAQLSEESQTRVKEFAKAGGE